MVPCNHCLALRLKTRRRRSCKWHELSLHRRRRAEAGARALPFIKSTRSSSTSAQWFSASSAARYVCVFSTEISASFPSTLVLLQIHATSTFTVSKQTRVLDTTDLPFLLKHLKSTLLEVLQGSLPDTSGYSTGHQAALLLPVECIST